MVLYPTRCMPAITRLTVVLLLLVSFGNSSAATPEQAQAARVEIAQIQAKFLQEVQSATGLSRTELDKFMPGGALYGAKSPSFIA